MKTISETRKTVRERAELLKALPGQRIPSATPAIMAEAEQIATGVICFYGNQPVKVGLAGIDWNGGHIIHQEWPAQLNRFYFLTSLASAFADTADERFAQAARSYIEDWIDNNPDFRSTFGKPGKRALDFGIRIGASGFHGWGGTLPVFMKSPCFDDAFLEKLLCSMEEQLRFLSEHLMPVGNHRIWNLDCLVVTSLRFPFFRDVEELIRRGATGLRNAFTVQFLDDGAHVELSPGYATGMTGVAANYLILKRIFPEADIGITPAALERSLAYCAQSELFPVNDSCAPISDPKEFERLTFARNTLSEIHQADKHAWTPPLDQAFPRAGQVFSRVGWAPGSNYLAFDASSAGGSHSHLSRLSFTYRSGGRALVADPGIISYEMSDPYGVYARSTRAHSTLNVNGGNQSGDGAVLCRTEFNADIALIHAVYAGSYWSGEYAWHFRQGHGQGYYGRHDRLLFWIKGEYILVTDVMVTDPGNRIHNCWQLGPMKKWSFDAKTLAWWSENEDTNLWMRMVGPPEGKTEMECFEGVEVSRQLREGVRNVAQASSLANRKPAACATVTCPLRVENSIRGWLGVKASERIPAPLVEFRYPGGMPAGGISTVLLSSFKGRERPDFNVRKRRQTEGGRVQYLELERETGMIDCFAWLPGLGAALECDTPFETDASFVWLRTDPHGEPVKLFALDASYLRRGGHVLLSGHERVPRHVRF